MRLRSVSVSHYKNLRDFSLAFDGDRYIDILVGKNGSGKSNFLEALIEIVDHVYSMDDGARSPAFDYEIEWEIEGKRTKIRWSAPRAETETLSQLVINGRSRKTIGKTPLPANLLVYYSGQNDHVARIVERYETAFRRRIKGSMVQTLPSILGIGPKVKTLLVWLLLLLPEDRAARRFVCDKLGILGNKREARLTLVSPVFADRRSYDPFVADDLFWGLQGVVRTFVDELLRCVRGGVTPGALYDRESNSYTIVIDIELFRRVFEGASSAELFRKFCALQLLGMLGDLTLTVTVGGFETPDLQHFSDGQFQSVYLFAVSELFKDRECITLLDEPDAFLHPEWQYQFLSQICQISEQAAKTNHIIMSSHSASTIAAKVDARLRVFEMNGRIVIPIERDKSTIIESLSAGLISFSEQEARLNINHVLKNSTGPVLLTEGISDEIILETAWKKLYGDRKRLFEIQGTFGCGFLGALLRDEAIYTSNPGRSLFGLFDFDEAYNNWNSNGTVIIQGDITRGLVRKKTDRPGYFMLLPVPPGLSIRSQVVNAAGDHFKAESLLPIELLFHDVPGLDRHFADDQSRPGNCRQFRGPKPDFASTVVPGLDAKYFECFRPLFEFIKDQIEPTTI